jgi:threonine/homoserine/homoserine lactone efflux protein
VAQAELVTAFGSWYVPTGLLIGFVAAAPIGPVNILVIQRALQRSLRSALVLGLGAAIGDALFAAAAAFGLTALTAEISGSRDLLRFVGGLIMLGFAIALWRSRPTLNQTAQKLPKAKHLALAIFAMTVTNPATVLWFVAAFQAVGFRHIGFGSNATISNGLMVIVGVFLGSMLWWLCIGGIASLWRHKLTDRHLTLANHFAAVVLVVSAVAAMSVVVLD